MPNNVTQSSFPPALDIPVTAAGSTAFGDDLSARDQSILLLVVWYASKHGIDDQGTVDVPDADLRIALGGLRAPDLDRREARFARLLQSRVTTDERIPDIDRDGVAAAILEPSIRRELINGAHRWIVDEALVDAFTAREGEAMVHVPLTLLASSRCRYTLPFFLRLQAWRKGDLEEEWLRRRNDHGIVLRLPPDELMQAVGYTSSKKPAKFLATALEPAAKEIDLHSSTKFEFDIVRAPSLRRLQGGIVRGYDLLVADTIHDKKPRKHDLGSNSGGNFIGSAARKAARSRVVPIMKPGEGQDIIDKPLKF